MQKIKFDFEATKQLIYAPNSTAPIGAPVDADGNVANDGTAIGIVLCRRNESDKYWVKQNLVVMVAGYCDIIDAQAIWGDEYSAEAIAAMSDITFCDNHELPTGGGGGDRWYVKDITDWDAEDPIVTLDKTFDEITTAINDGKRVILVGLGFEFEIVVNYEERIEFTHLFFSVNTPDLMNLSFAYFIVNSDNSVEMSFKGTQISVEDL